VLVLGSLDLGVAQRLRPAPGKGMLVHRLAFTRAFRFEWLSRYSHQSPRRAGAPRPLEAILAPEKQSYRRNSTTRQ
jgi:hypothetical protein